MFSGTLSPTTNNQDWSESVKITDTDTGDSIDLSDVDQITVTLREPGSSSDSLTGTLTGGEIAIIETGVFNFSFPATSMSALCGRKTYTVGCLLEKDDQTLQLFLGSLPVLEGVP